MKLAKVSQKLISDVVSIPTAPFQEHKVIGYVIRFCLKHGLKMKQDKVGNIFIRIKRGRAKQPVVFTAHMDHPGFEVLSSKNGYAEVVILGGVNLDYFETAHVVIAEGDRLVRGVVAGPLKKKWMGKPVFRVRTKDHVSRGTFGYYSLPGFRMKNEMIYTKSADNLAGTALLLDLLRSLRKKRSACDVTVVLTRAEELGFIGAIHVADDRSISRKVPLIVVETSNAKAGGVLINGGPVIRVGDKQSGFRPEVDSWMIMIADKLSKKKKSFKYQRALLSGGRCEASAYMLKGYMVGGVAFPLGNYHNNGSKTYAPEYIGSEDYADMLEFFLQLSMAPKLKVAFQKKEKELWNNYRKWADKL